MQLSHMRCTTELHTSWHAYHDIACHGSDKQTQAALKASSAQHGWHTAERMYDPVELNTHGDVACHGSTYKLQLHA